MAPAKSPTKFIPIATVCERVGLGRSRVYELERAHAFPQRLKIGAKTLYVESEVEAWQRAAIAARGAA